MFLVQRIGRNAGLGIVELAVIVGVMTANTGPVTRGPLVLGIGVDVQAILVFGCQLFQVGAVLAETFGDTSVGAQQGGVEGPVQGFDVGVAPLTVVVVQALTTELQDLARVCLLYTSDAADE